MKDNIQRIDGDELLKKHFPEKQYCYCGSHGEWEAVSISEIWVSGGPVKYQIHAQIVKPEPIRIDYVISKEQYEKWQKTKGNKRRINLLLAVSQNTLKLRKIPATKHIDIRVTEELYDKLKGYADRCKMPVSDYCREILKGGSAPKAALTSEEYDVMKKVIDFKHNIILFRNASLDVISKVPKEKRSNYVIEGMPYSWWEASIDKALSYLNHVIKKVSGE